MKVVELTFVALLFGALFLTSCAPQDDPTATPANTDPREKFRGNWAVSENSNDFGPTTYNCTITDSSQASYIFIAYLYAFNKKIYSTVSGNTFSIPVQTIQGKNVSGNGVLANVNQINLTYYVQTTSIHYDTVTAVLTK